MSETAHDLSVERAEALGDAELAELCEATDAAIIEGGGFGWVAPQGREALARHFRGVLMVPERELFVARLDGHPVGSAQLLRPPRHNEAQAWSAQLTHAYLAPYARGHGLARLMVRRVEERAAALGHRVLNLDVRETQAVAIGLFESLGYVRWGTHPASARVAGRTVAGHHYYKLLEPARGRPHGALFPRRPLPPGRLMGERAMAGFTVYPAVDLKAGRAVRLRRGEMGTATDHGDPAERARAFDAAGFEWLHLVDLDGAFAGRPANAGAVRAVLAATTRPVQLGGGVRDRATLEGWLAAGVARVILGSAAAKDPGFVREACRAHPGRVAIGVDARGGLVATEGWAETGTLTALELALRYEDAGAAAIVHTDVDRDGMLGGANVEATAALAARLTTPVIASGGVSGPEDLAALRAAGSVAGAVVGRALYEGRLTAAQALRNGPPED